MSTPISAIRSLAAVTPNPGMPSSWATCRSYGSHKTAIRSSSTATWAVSSSMLSSIIWRMKACPGVKNEQSSASSSRAIFGRIRPRAISASTSGHAFILQMMLDSIDELTAQVAVLDERIAVLCEPYERQVAQLDGIPGFGVTAARDLIAEIGVDMSAFATAGHLCSRARVAPRARESGKRKGRSATGRGSPYIGGTLGETAASAGRTQAFLGAKLR